MLQNALPFFLTVALDSKRVLNVQKEITSFMESVHLAVFSWGACRITSSLFLSFISPGATGIELIINLQVFLDKRGEMSGCFIEATSKKVPD